MFSLLMPTFSLVLRPYVLTVILQPTTQRSPTHYTEYNDAVSVIYIVPVYFRRGVA